MKTVHGYIVLATRMKPVLAPHPSQVKSSQPWINTSIATSRPSVSFVYLFSKSSFFFSFFDSQDERQRLL